MKSEDEILYNRREYVYHHVIIWQGVKLTPTFEDTQTHHIWLFTFSSVPLSISSSFTLNVLFLLARLFFFLFNSTMQNPQPNCSNKWYISLIYGHDELSVFVYRPGRDLILPPVK